MLPRALTRSMSALGTLVVAAATVTACGAGTGDANTITYAIWDEDQRPAMQQIADEFEAENEGVTVDVQLTPNAQYWTTLQTALTGGSGPDVFWMNAPRLPFYAKEGQLAPMGDAIDASIYPSSLLDLYTYDDQMWGAPKDFDTVGLWFNTKLFDEAGVEHPDDTWTWDDVTAAAEKITDADAGVFGIAAAPYTQSYIYPTIAQAGGYVIDETESESGYGSPEAAEAIDYLVNFVEQGYSPTGAQLVDTEPGERFGSGTIGMYYAPSYVANSFSKSEAADDLQVAVLPSGPTSNTSVVHGLANVANANGKNVQLATAFAAFASSARAAEIQASTGTVLPSVIGSQQGWVDAFPQYNAQVFVDMVETATPYPVSLDRATWGELETEVFPQIWAGSVSIEDGLKDLATRMQEVLDNEGD